MENLICGLDFDNCLLAAAIVEMGKDKKATALG